MGLEFAIGLLLSEKTIYQHLTWIRKPTEYWRSPVNGASEKFAVKVPLELKCSGCGEPASIKIHLDETSFDWTCPKCNFFHPSFLGLFTVGVLLLEKSWYELKVEKDYSMAIVFAAMAFESQLSYLYGKWRSIDAGEAGEEIRAQCEREMRDFMTIDRKIAEVSKLLIGKGMDEFVSALPDLCETITTRLTSLRLGSLANDFQKHLFWPRNAILHWGDKKHSYEDAVQCWSLADFGLWILQRMDEERRRGLV